MSIRHLFSSAFAATALLGAASAGIAAPLTVDVYNPGAHAIFPVSSEIVSGKTEAILIDAQFQRNDAQALVSRIKASGKTLKAVYVSHSDPDYYFGLETIHAAFPHAKIVATPQTVAAIEASKDGKLAYWGPILKDNAPTSVIVPQPLDGNTLRVDGEPLRIVGLDGPTPDRTFVWIPSTRTVVGGIPVAANIHVWMADTQTPLSHANWLATLDRIDALKPARVVPGHFLPNRDGSQPFATGVAFTRDYVKAFDDEAARAKDSAALIAAMEARYPDLGEKSSLELSAKVAKGEMQWPAPAPFPAAGRTVRVQFGATAFDLHFQDDKTMSFVGTAGQFNGVTDTVQYTAREIRPQVYMVYWHEPSTGSNVVHVEDFERGAVDTNIATKDGQFLHMSGTLKIVGRE
ncbi:MBL fold metallo-hydrolase [Burkholderia cenocepacia]|nr:MBL fold metallo-hydrolase [Burkholderia cenocepacia]RQU86927.1 MBL fold metallo-hydrolase [Burkholderia cenocepacia]RQV84200.1 MBL fold metallo-hydrolase [Burkholderia cenocepacia]